MIYMCIILCFQVILFSVITPPFATHFFEDADATSPFFFSSPEPGTGMNVSETLLLQNINP